MWCPNADGDRQNEGSDKLKAASTIRELQTFAELRAVRGFYPKVHLVAPDTFALMQAAASSTISGASSISLDILLENMKAGECTKELRFSGVESARRGYARLARSANSLMRDA